ncbi:MAG: hypothetical protein ACR2OT_04180, partial [Parvibaculales bacterium]
MVRATNARLKNTREATPPERVFAFFREKSFCIISQPQYAWIYPHTITLFNQGKQLWQVVLMRKEQTTN